MDPTQFDPTQLGAPAVQVAAITILVNYVKFAWLTDETSARYSPLIALVVGLLVGLMASGVTGDPPGRAMALGAGYGLASTLLYPVLPARFKGRTRNDPPASEPPMPPA